MTKKEVPGEKNYQFIFQCNIFQLVWYSKESIVVVTSLDSCKRLLIFFSRVKVENSFK